MKTGLVSSQFSGEDPHDANTQMPEATLYLWRNKPSSASPKGPKLRESPMSRIFTGGASLGKGTVLFSGRKRLEGSAVTSRNPEAEERDSAGALPKSGSAARSHAARRQGIPFTRIV